MVSFKKSSALLLTLGFVAQSVVAMQPDAQGAGYMERARAGLGAAGSSLSGAASSARAGLGNAAAGPGARLPNSPKLRDFRAGAIALPGNAVSAINDNPVYTTLALIVPLLVTSEIDYRSNVAASARTFTGRVPYFGSLLGGYLAAHGSLLKGDVTAMKAFFSAHTAFACAAVVLEVSVLKGVFYDLMYKKNSPLRALISLIGRQFPAAKTAKGAAPKAKRQVAALDAVELGSASAAVAPQQAARSWAQFLGLASNQAAAATDAGNGEGIPPVERPGTRPTPTGGRGGASVALHTEGHAWAGHSDGEQVGVDAAGAPAGSRAEYAAAAAEWAQANPSHKAAEATAAPLPATAAAAPTADAPRDLTPLPVGAASDAEIAAGGASAPAATAEAQAETHTATE